MKIEWVQHASVYPLKSRCGRFKIGCYIGSNGPRYLGWHTPHHAPPVATGDNMRGTLEEARLDAEEFAASLPEPVAPSPL